mmetsp:Transcript_43125/g.125556  ORF Transcript_43125/g.125556 Transcript_43125/m.125556 type:complete len:103 (-) Transcript_43125:167-475(-)
MDSAMPSELMEVERTSSSGSEKSLRSVRFDMNAVTVCEVEGGRLGAQLRRADPWVAEKAALESLFGQKRVQEFSSLLPTDLSAVEAVPIGAICTTILMMALI